MLFNKPLLFLYSLEILKIKICKINIYSVTLLQYFINIILLYLKIIIILIWHLIYTYF